MPVGIQYLVGIAAFLYICEWIGKRYSGWQAERDEMTRFKGRIREEQKATQLESRRADYAYQRYTDRLAAGDTPSEASEAFDVAVQWAQKNIH
jgi:hypothetical protein